MADPGDVILLLDGQEVINRALMRERVMSDRNNPLENLLPEQVKSRYRFFPETLYEICRIVRPHSGQTYQEVLCITSIVASFNSFTVLCNWI